MTAINDRLNLKKIDVKPSGHKLAYNPLGHLVGILIKRKK